MDARDIASSPQHAHWALEIPWQNFWYKNFAPPHARVDHFTRTCHDQSADAVLTRLPTTNASTVRGTDRSSYEDGLFIISRPVGSNWDIGICSGPTMPAQSQALIYIPIPDC